MEPQGPGVTLVQQEPLVRRAALDSRVPRVPRASRGPQAPRDRLDNQEVQVYLVLKDQQAAQVIQGFQDRRGQLDQEGLLALLESVDHLESQELQVPLDLQEA